MNGQTRTVVVVLICLTQTIGFFCPAWFCNKDVDSKNSNPSMFSINRTVISNPNNTTPNRHDTCDFKGLFYPDGITDMEVFNLSIASMVGVWLCTAILLCLILCTSESDCGDCVKVFCFFVVFVCQILAGVVGIICLLRYDRIGWSLIMFMAVGMTIVAAMCADAANEVRNKRNA